jgi:hypothetical protein
MKALSVDFMTASILRDICNLFQMLNQSWRIRQLHPLALGLSIIAHAFLYIAISIHGGPKDHTGSPRRAASKVLTVQLKNADSVIKPSATDITPYETNQNQQAAHLASMTLTPAPGSNPPANASTLETDKFLIQQPSSFHDMGAEKGNATQNSLPDQSVNTSPSTEKSVDKTPPLPILNSPEVHYYTALELSERPQISSGIAWELIPELQELPPQSVIMHIFVNEQGDVDKATLEINQLPELAQTTLINNLLKLKFRPGQINEAAVKSEVVREITIAP